MTQNSRSIIVCTTCKFQDGRKLDDEGLSAGQRMVAALKSVTQSRSDVVVQEQVCMWNCTKPCSVVLRDDKRYSYVTGGHVPSEAQAEAIVQWFDAHGATEKGEVPFRQWPDLMRGHFIARMPPVGEGETS
jgi:predicted metal-binding protein